MATFALAWTDRPPPEITGGAITIGNFDGVHRGHQALVAAVRQAAVRVGGPAVVVTFDPPPAALLYPRPDKAIPLTTLTERAALLQSSGADHVVVLTANASLLSLSPEAFVEDVIVRLFAARAVAEGYNFHFGRGRTGDTRVLRRLCQQTGIAFDEVPECSVQGEPVSSSRVRTALNEGNVSLTRELLGRPYRITGSVISGAQRGRTIGFPTANVGEIPTLVPATGVYAVRATVQGTTYSAAANIGPNPTFGEDARKIEVHILDFSGDVYGQPIAVEFIARLRETRPFASVDELVTQLHQDISAARVTLSE